ncbi:MAG: hypothetical protein R3F14_24485 [Polyangiaceae bacterium]
MLLAKTAGVDRAIVAKALIGDPRIGIDTGANRNALLLEGAGEAIVMCDDDVRPRFAPAPGSPARAAISAPARRAPPNPTAAVRPTGSPDNAPAPGTAPHFEDTLTLDGVRVRSGSPVTPFFSDAGSPLVRDEEWRSLDPISLHESLLGVDVAQAVLDEEELSVARGEAQDGLDGRLLGRLVRRGGRVVITQVGSAGDHGMGGSFGLMLLRGEARERLMRSEEAFLAAFEQRRVMQCAEEATIAETDQCMSMHLGIDARELVPPFVFAGRNSDGVMGTVLRACVDDAFFGFLPWAVEHAPETERRASFEAEIASVGSAGVNELLRLAIGGLAEARGAGTAAQLASLGRAIERLGTQETEARATMREQAVRALGRRLVQIEQLLDEHRGAPDTWARAMERFADALRAAIVRDDLHVPAELAAAHGADAGWQLFLAYLCDVGQLFANWPALFEAAQELSPEATPQG